jgi:hypothetical protein
LERILKRHGIKVTVSTLCDWVAAAADLLTPVVEKMHKQILDAEVIYTDDTSIPVRNKNRAGSTYTGYLWVYIDQVGNVVFDFTPTRSRQGPLDFLGDYEGYVHADAYSGYDGLFNKGKAIEVGCNSHARRKFEYAMDTDPLRATRFLSYWSKLYGIEKQAKEQKFTAEQLLEIRQRDALPVFDEIRKFIDEVLNGPSPPSPKNLLRKAINYTLNQWDALKKYTEDPRLSIDNNLSERVLRQVVIGRKNYLFAGSETGARRAATIYSLVESCRLNGIDPFAYFCDVLKRVNTCPANEIEQLLPCNWQPPKADDQVDASILNQLNSRIF